MGVPMNFWLMKSEPESFSIDDLAAAPDRTTCWDGVRNYQARNFLREMKVGDQVLFYHSSTDQPAVMGTAVVVREAHPDPTAWQKGHEHFDPKASPENPIWQMVDIWLAEVFPAPVTLERLRGVKALLGMELLRRGSRLSVQRVSAEHFAIVVSLGGTGGPANPASRATAARRTLSARGTAKRKAGARPQRKLASDEGRLRRAK